MIKTFSRVNNLFKKLVTCVHSCSQNPPKSPIFINDISYLFISFKGQDNTHESSKGPSSSFLKPRLNIWYHVPQLNAKWMVQINQMLNIMFHLDIFNKTCTNDFPFPT